MPGPWEDILKIILRWLLPRLLNVIGFVFKYCKRIVAQSCSQSLHFQKIPWCESGHIATAANLYILIKCTNDILFLVYDPNKICKTLSREHLMCEWFRLVTRLSTAEMGKLSLKCDTGWHVSRNSRVLSWVSFEFHCWACCQPLHVSILPSWHLDRAELHAGIPDGAVSPIPSGMQESPPPLQQGFKIGIVEI